MVYDMFPNLSCDFLVCLPNVTLALKSKTEVSVDEGRTDTRFTLDDVTL